MSPTRVTLISLVAASVSVGFALATALARRRSRLAAAAAAAATAALVGPRVVFLDLDGVVNRTKTNCQIILEATLVAQLRAIVERGGARDVQIVLSTFWRPFDAYVSYALHRHGVDGALVVGATPGRSRSTPVQTAPGMARLLPPRAFAPLGGDREEPPHCFFPNRAAEIRAWLAAHPQVEKFAILDDRADAADGDDLLPCFVRTDPTVGLTDAHVAQALALLS